MLLGKRQRKINPTEWMAGYTDFEGTNKRKQANIRPLERLIHNYYLPDLLEREEQLEAALHDLRHHALIMRQFAREGDGEKLEAYLDSFVETLPGARATVFYCEHHVINTLLVLYASQARRQETSFTVKTDLSQDIAVRDADLSVLLSNILENALEAALDVSAELRSVSVSIIANYEILGIKVRNPCCGEAQVKNGRLYSTKKTGRKGVGLNSVRLICRSYGGDFNFRLDSDNIFQSEIMLPLQR